MFPRKPPEPPAPAPPQPSLFPTERGDAEAWSRLIDEYQGRLLRFALARAAQPADAEDIVQETFTSFIRVVNHLQVHVSLETYLFGILRNEIVNRFRTRWARAVCLIQDVYRTGTDDASHGWIFDLVRWRLLLRGRLRPGHRLASRRIGQRQRRSPVAAGRTVGEVKPADQSPGLIART